MWQIEEDIKELKRLNTNLDYFERRRKLRNNLKVVVIGFLIWKDLDEKIAREEIVRKTLLIQLRNLFLNAGKDFDLLIKSDFFIMKKDLDSYRAKWFSITPLFDEFKIKNSWNIDLEKTINQLQAIFQNGNRILETHNNEFIKKEQEKYKDFLTIWAIFL